MEDLVFVAGKRNGDVGSVFRLESLKILSLFVGHVKVFLLTSMLLKSGFRRDCQKCHGKVSIKQGHALIKMQF